MTPEKQTGASTELMQLRPPGRLAAAAAVAELAVLSVAGGLVHERQAPDKPPVCLERACGRIALQAETAAASTPLPHLSPAVLELLPVRPYEDLNKERAPTAAAVPKRTRSAPRPTDLRLPLHSLSLPAAPKSPGFSPRVLRQGAGEKEGADVSFPQCPEVVPGSKTAWTIKNLEDTGFGLVGITDYSQKDSVNPCLIQELSWAQGVGLRGVYANPMNPGNTGNPKAFGYGQAKYIVQKFLEAARTQRLSTDPTRYEWWLDVETGNKWRGSQADNRAVILGWAQYLRGIGVRPNVYSTSHQLTTIAGTFTPGNAGELQGADSWIPLGSCHDAPLLPGGRILMTQTVHSQGGHEYDYDTVCR